MPKGQYERKPKAETQPQEPQPEIQHQPPKAEGPSWEQFQAMQRELQMATQQIAALANRNAEFERSQNSGGVLPEHEQPMYECTQPYMSPDDVYYPEGVQFVDVTGQIIPNESMVPLNEAAKHRMDAYLATLPAPGGTPSLEDMIDATMQVARQYGDNADRAQLAGAVMQRAIELKYGRMGTVQDPMKRPVFVPPTRAADLASIPLMSNTNIRGASHVPERPGQVPRSKIMTRIPLPSDNAPVMASVQTR